MKRLFYWHEDVQGIYIRIKFMGQTYLCTIDFLINLQEKVVGAKLFSANVGGINANK